MLRSLTWASRSRIRRCAEVGSDSRERGTEWPHRGQEGDVESGKEETGGRSTAAEDMLVGLWSCGRTKG